MSNLAGTELKSGGTNSQGSVESQEIRIKANSSSVEYFLPKDIKTYVLYRLISSHVPEHTAMKQTDSASYHSPLNAASSSLLLHRLALLLSHLAHRKRQPRHI